MMSFILHLGFNGGRTPSSITFVSRVSMSLMSVKGMVSALIDHAVIPNEYTSHLESYFSSLRISGAMNTSVPVLLVVVCCSESLAVPKSDSFALTSSLSVENETRSRMLCSKSMLLMS